nr:DUF4124 domain-containing protein [Ramlibacter albus]
MCFAFVGCLLAAIAAPVHAQIYTCTDAKGRRLTADRPIPECMDRQQQELNSSGTVRRTIKPQMTAEERAAEEERERRAAEARQREDEEKRRGRALLTRYPDADSHQRERSAAHRTVDDMIAAGRKREADLETERQKLTSSSAASDPASRARIARQLEEIARQLAVQRRQLADANEEKKRIDARFNEELARLKPLWSQQTAAQPASQPVRR